jgi:hypothetical protein
MPQHKILTRTLLVLSIINFALAAPVTVRERPEVRHGAIVKRNVTAASQKRWDLRGNEWDTTNLPEPDHGPLPGADLSLAEILWLTGQSDHLPLTPDVLPSPGPPSPGPPSPGSSTESQLPVPGPDHAPRPGVADLSLAEILWLTGQSDHLPLTPDVPSSPDPPSPGSSTGSRLPAPQPNHALSPSPDSTDMLSQMEYNNNLPGSVAWPDHMPPSPGSSGLLPVPELDHAPPRSPDLNDILSQIPPPPPPPHPTQPGPSDDRFPPGFSPKPDTSLATGSTVSHPTSPQDAGVDPEMHSLLSAGSFPTEFWDTFLKDKIKRQIFGSDAVNLAQKN